MPCSAKMVLLVIGVVSTVCVVIFMSTYFSANGSNEVDMGAGDDLSVVKESSGFHILEVRNTGSGDGQGWTWVEVVCVILAIKLGLIITHGIHYFFVTKKIVKYKVARERVNIKMSNVAAREPPALQIPALP